MLASKPKRRTAKLPPVYAVVCVDGRPRVLHVCVSRKDAVNDARYLTDEYCERHRVVRYVPRGRKDKFRAR